LAIAALVTGACAATIMALIVSRIDRDFTLTSLLVLAILGIGLGVTSLILSLQKPARFAGVPLAIAGLAMGTAALVYYFTF
jgi:thiol:disulfide interchange protein